MTDADFPHVRHRGTDRRARSRHHRKRRGSGRVRDLSVRGQRGGADDRLDLGARRLVRRPRVDAPVPTMHLRHSITAAGFWLGTLLPIVYLPVIIAGIDSMSRLSLFVALLTVHAFCARRRPRLLGIENSMIAAIGFPVGTPRLLPLHLPLRALFRRIPVTFVTGQRCTEKWYPLNRGRYYYED